MSDYLFCRSLHFGMTTLILASGSLLLTLPQLAQATPTAVSSIAQDRANELLASGRDDDDDDDDDDRKSCSSNLF